MIRGCWRDMTFSAEGSRRLPASWPSVGSPKTRVQDERPFIAFPHGFVALVTGKYRRNEPERNVGNRPSRTSFGLRFWQFQRRNRMIYAILAYHHETDVMSWTPQEDADLMERLTKAHEKVNEVGRLGPAARLSFTGKARTLRGPGNGMVIDGPFAETKEQLLGFYLYECAT